MIGENEIIRSSVIRRLKGSFLEFVLSSKHMFKIVLQQDQIYYYICLISCYSVKDRPRCENYMDRTVCERYLLFYGSYNKRSMILPVHTEALSPFIS